jgi:non-specific serine/threonine protein kinase
MVRDALPEGVGLRSLGSHALKGLERAEEVYQLLHPALPAAFPPLLSPQAPRSNLPAALTSFIGREAEVAAVRALLAHHRLVTLTGEGGSGKTRLALQVAGELLEAYADGVWLVELAPLADPALVVQAVATALGVREEPGRALMTSLSEYLREKTLLLVLDNCEHLVAACAELVSDLLRCCPKLTIVATSREGLGVAGERRYRVPMLGLPDARRQVTLEQLGGYEAVQLLLERGQACRSGFALTAHNAWAVEQVCRRLDGLPLALELAAARLSTLSIEQVARRLDDRFRLLTGGSRSALPHQQTLRATLDWSHALLREPERVLFRRLAVFAGGWTLEAAEAVCAGEGIEQEDVLDLLNGLVQRSLVRVEEGGGEPRYGLLETVREYGRERLEECQEAANVRDRHLEWCVALAEAAEPELTGPEQVRWLERLEVEHDNLRAALGWARERGKAELGLRLAGALWRFWDRHGHMSEGRGWLDGALAGGDGTTAARAKALRGAGSLVMWQGEYKRAAALHEEALALRRELGDRRGIVSSLTDLGIVAFYQGEHNRAAALIEEALTFHRELGNRRGIADSLSNLGNLAYYQAEYGRAAALYEEALARYRDLGDRHGIATLLHNLGDVAQALGEYGRAGALVEEALALFRALGDQRAIAGSLGNLGRVVFRQGEYGRAAALQAEGLLLSRDLGARHLQTLGLEGLAWVAAARGQALRAAWLGGAAAELRGALGTPLPTAARADHDQAVLAMRAALGEQAFAAAWAEGRSLSLEEAIACALQDGGPV